MREIKFRAWDKKRKCWINPSKIALKEKEYQDLIYCDMDGFGIMEDGLPILADECGQFRYLDPERFVIMQYTGLKDKKGKEIYEGDIVKTKFGIGEVFERLGCWFVSMQKELGYFSDFELEVIGNIWENKELLNE